MLAAAPTDEAAIIARVKAGDARATRALYDLHFGFVHRTARGLGTPASEVEDVAQEVFAIAFRSIDRFQAGKFSTWLYRLCANVVTDHHRRRRVRTAFSALFGEAEERIAPGPSPEGHAQQSEAKERVAEVLARMAPKKREVFALFEIEGLTGEEIAERVGCGVATVWTRLHHARKDFTRIARKRGLLDA